MPHVPSGLISASAWQRLATLPGGFPAAGMIGAFECRLEAGTEQVDFEVCLSAGAGSRAALAAGLASFAHGMPAGDARWARSLEFLRVWADPGAALGAITPILWLEFDLDEAAAVEPGPFVIATLDPAQAFEEGSAGRPPLAPALDDVVGCLNGGPIDAATRGCLERCLNELPPNGRLLHIAVRPGGDETAVRAILQLPWPLIGRYLDRIGWDGDHDALAAWLARTCTSARLHSINVDLTDRVGPRVGIEYHYAAEQWTPLFDVLQEQGACAAERRVQLTAWAAEGRPATGVVRVDRELLVKVVFERGAPLRAKAYLAFAPRLDSSALLVRDRGVGGALSGLPSVRAHT